VVAKPGEEAEVERILETMVEYTRAEPGWERYEVLRSVEDPRRFLLFEVYKDELALEAHFKSAHFQRYVLGEAMPRLESRVRYQLQRIYGRLTLVEPKTERSRRTLVVPHGGAGSLRSFNDVGLHARNPRAAAEGSRTHGVVNFVEWSPDGC
jgi:quinol monooxygenase YgiN